MTKTKTKRKNKTYKGKLTKYQRSRTNWKIAIGIAVIAMAGLKMHGNMVATEIVLASEVVEVRVEKESKELKDIVWNVAKSRGWSDENIYHLLKIADCESRLDPYAINVNKDGSLDLGLYQINNKYQPQVSKECAFDVACATNEAINIANKWGNFNAWVCNRYI